MAIRPISEVTSAYNREMPYAFYDSTHMNGTHKSVVGITCSECDETLTAPVTNKVPPPNMLRNRAHKTGWSTSRKDALCPACLTKRRNKPVTKQTQITAPSPSQTPPREPTKADNRAIFRKLDEVYDEQNEGYVGDFNDEVVATELKVPRKWVEDIRSEHFGPAVDANVQKAVKELEGLRKRVDQMMDQMLRNATQCEKQLAEVDAELVRLRKAGVKP